MSRQAISLLDLTVRASGAVTEHRAVGYDGAQATVQGQKVLGVSRYAAPAGTDVAATVAGTAVVETGAEIDIGDSLICDAQGRAMPAVDDGSAEYVFGDALQAAGAAGAFIEIKLRG